MDDMGFEPAEFASGDRKDFFWGIEVETDGECHRDDTDSGGNT